MTCFGFNSNQNRRGAGLRCLQGGREFEAMARPYAVVMICRGDQRRRIIRPRFDVVQRRIGIATSQFVQFCIYLFWLQVRLLMIVITGGLWYRALKEKRRLASELKQGGPWPRALIGATAESTQTPLFARDYLNFLDHAVRDEWCATVRRWSQDTQWFLLYTRRGSTVVLDVMLYGSGVVFLLMLFNLRV